MRVLKFGGTSVGSSASILKVKQIVESRQEPVIVVTAALDGITDQLIATSKLAVKGNDAYKISAAAIVNRHHELIDSVFTDASQRAGLMQRVDALLNELNSIYQGISLIRDYSERTANVIVSYGERLSALILEALIDGAQHFDSREFIKTEQKSGHQQLAVELTDELIAKTFVNQPVRSVVPGFISSDSRTGEVTNLGRGGSDYTAAILAAALDAEALEIWTDVDGFMTADPKVITSAYPIEELSYVEATELCNFGVKVIYPPTIYPVCAKHIPILIKNTFNPDAKGTVIKDKVTDNGRSIRGISSISNTTLITVSAPSMAGLVGINRRIFTTLADNGISVFFVAQSSSETGISIGVPCEDADLATQCLDEVFEKEIQLGSMYPIQQTTELATVAVVGENMRKTAGISGRLFGTIGRSGISIIACAQGASETNISFIVEKSSLRKTLNVIHDSFFLSEYQQLNVFVCGVGTVGSNLIDQIRLQQEKLMRERRLKINVVGIASGHNAMFSRAGLALDHFREDLKASAPSDIERLRSEVIGMNIFNSVFVDCTASAEVASLYQDFLEHNISVVAANKIAASSDYDTYAMLKKTAVKRGVKFLFETNVGAGLPIIGTINDLRNSGDKILRIEAVLSGTLNFICNQISAETPFSQTVQMAKEQGYSEPDPRIDLSGKDVIRKLVILAREAGYRINQEDVQAELFVPDSYFKGSLDDFWSNLPALDADFETRRKKLASEQKHWRFVAKYEDGKASVSLCEIGPGHPFYNLEGSNNIILLTTDRYHDYPMLIQGYGAGASVTAAGVFADIMSIANI